MGSIDFTSKLDMEDIREAADDVASALDGNGDLITAASTLLDLVRTLVIEPNTGDDGYPLTFTRV